MCQSKDQIATLHEEIPPASPSPTETPESSVLPAADVEIYANGLQTNRNPCWAEQYNSAVGKNAQSLTVMLKEGDKTEAFSQTGNYLNFSS